MKFLNGYLAPGAIIAAIAALIIGVKTKDLYLTLYLSLGIATLIMFWVYVNDLIGRKKQQSIINSKLFQELLSSGYEHEIYGEFNGIIGRNGGSSIRIFYDWNKMAKGFLSRGDIKIIIYFRPSVNNFENAEKADIKLKDLQDKYGNDLYHGVRTFITHDRLIICINYYPWTSLKRVNKKLVEGLEILTKENLEPLDLSHVPVELKEYQINDGFLPNTELIFEYLEEKYGNR